MFVQYSDLINIDTKNSEEIFVEITTLWLYWWYLKSFKIDNSLLWNKIYVRKRVWEMLLLANNNLKKHWSSLFVTFGYRSLKIQTERFQQRLQQIAKEKFYPNSIDLYEQVHKNIAVPTVAWHPTWWAVDVTLIDQNGNMLDMGAPMYDYSKPWYETFASWISDEAKQNRMILREAMIQTWFAPFDGEYWHFSYGDKEWAFYYKKPYALYNQVPEDAIKL